MCMHYLKVDRKEKKEKKSSRDVDSKSQAGRQADSKKAGRQGETGKMAKRLR